MANNIANQTKNAQVNSFTGGINTDLHPMLQPNNTLTDCVNGTLITYNGNENMLQNDMGNYALEGAKLPPNYVPIGVKEHAGILYVVAYNPLTKRTQIGSYPSPKVNFKPEDEAEAKITIEPYKIKSFDGSNDSFDPFYTLNEEFKPEQGEYHLYSNVIKNADNLLEYLGTMDHDKYKLTINDQYSLVLNPDLNSDPWLQELMFFAVSKDGKIENITEKLNFQNNHNDYNNVDWQSEGWLGVKYELADVTKSTQTVTNVVYPTYGRTLNTIWTVEENDGYKIATSDLNKKSSFYEDPFIMIPNNKDNSLIWQKHYWQSEIPIEDNTIVYYSKNEWIPQRGVNYSTSTSQDQSYYHKIVFEDSVQNLEEIMSKYIYSSLDGDEYLYLFLPKHARIESSQELFFPNLKLFVFIHPDSEESFVFESNLEFINKPVNASINVKGHHIKELYCSKYDNLSVDYDKVGVLVDGSENEIFSIPPFSNVISDSNVNVLVDSNDSLDEEYLTITYQTSNGLKVALGSEFKEKVIEHTYEKAGVGKITILGKSISDNAFKECSTLIEINIPYGITDIGMSAFEKCSLVEIVIPDSVEYVGYGAFSGCEELTYLSMSNKIDRVVASLCRDCKALTDVIIGTSVKSIGFYAFSGCSSLSNIDIPASVCTLEANAFENCTSLEKIILPDSIETIGMSAFNGCSQLKYCKLPRNMEVLDTYTFLKSGLKTIVCGHKLKEIGLGAVPANTRIYILNSEQPVDFSTLESFSGGKGLTKTLDIYVPESIIDEYIEATFGNVTTFNEKSTLIYFADEKLSIGGTHNFDTGVGHFSIVGEFLGGFESQKIHTVIIPESVISIDEDAFKNSSIQSIFIPANIKSIESKAFYNCLSLKWVELEGSVDFKKDVFGGTRVLSKSWIDIVRTSNIENWCNNTFENEYSSPLGHPSRIYNTKLYVGNDSNEITIPDTVKSIGPYIFVGLKDVTLLINHTLARVNENAFNSLFGNNLVIKYSGNEISNIQNKTFANINVYVKPELYYKYMFDLKLSGTWKSLYTNVYTTGKYSKTWFGEHGEIVGPVSSNNIQYVVPSSWQYRENYSDDFWKCSFPEHVSASVKDTDYSENIFYKYIYNVLRSNENIVGWKFSEENNLEIYVLSNVDSSVKISIETVTSGNWKWSTHAPYKINDSNSNIEKNIVWYSGENPMAISTGDVLKFTINNEVRLPKTIWKNILDSQVCNIKWAIRLVGYSENGDVFTTKFENGKSYYYPNDIKIVKSNSFIEVSSEFNFSSPIPANIDKINIESILFCVENIDNTGRILVFDQTLQSDTILLPEYENIDNSSAEVVGFIYSVSGTGEDGKVDNTGMRTVECIFTFNEFIESEDVSAVLRDVNGDSVIYGTTSSGGVNNEHVIKFLNVPKEFQFAQLELVVESDSKFKEDILINTKVTTSKSGWFNRINMSTIPWNKVINEIIADIDNNEWDLNVSVEVDESQAVSKPCVYGLNENDEIVDLTEWTEDTIPADVVPIVDEDGYIPGYENLQLADMVYAPVKINITLGGGIEIYGSTNSAHCKYSINDKVIKNTIPYQSAIGNFTLSPLKLCNLYFEKDLSNKTLGVPVPTRYAKNLYKPLYLEKWLDNISGLDSNDRLILNEYWKSDKNDKIVATINANKSLYYQPANKNFIANGPTYNNINDASKELGTIFPVKVTNLTTIYGVNVPIYISDDKLTIKTRDYEKDASSTWKHGQWVSFGAAGKAFNTNIKNTIISVVSKDTKYTFGIRCKDDVRYPWLKNEALWNESDFYEFEKLLFLISLICCDTKHLDSRHIGDLYYINNLNQKHSFLTKATTITNPTIKIKNCNYVLNDFDIEISVNLSTDISSSMYNHMLYIKNMYLKSKNPSGNITIDNYMKSFKKDYYDSNEICTALMTNTAADKWSLDYAVIFYRYLDTVRYWLKESRNIEFNRGGYQVSISGITGESALDHGYKYLEDTNSPFEYTKQTFGPWSDVSNNDFFNQLHQKFAPDGKLTLTIDGVEKTQTVDEWLEYYLKLLIEEQKYEQDYNKLKN